MTGGTEFSEAEVKPIKEEVEASPEKQAEIKEAAEVQRATEEATHAPETTKEKMEYAPAEDLMSALVEAVDAVPEVAKAKPAEISLSPDDVKVDGVGEGGITIVAAGADETVMIDTGPLQESAAEIGEPDPVIGDLSSAGGPAAEASVDPNDETSSVGIIDSNDREVEAVETAADQGPETEGREGAAKAAADGRPGTEDGDTPLPPSAQPEGSEQGSVSENDQHVPGSTDHYPADAAAFTMEAAADQVSEVSDKLGGFNQALEAANKMAREAGAAQDEGEHKTTKPENQKENFQEEIPNKTDAQKASTTPTAESSLDGKTHNASDHYSGVNQIQGEVARDSDWNEGSSLVSNESGEDDEGESETQTGASSSSSGGIESLVAVAQAQAEAAQQEAEELAGKQAESQEQKKKIREIGETYAELHADQGKPLSEPTASGEHLVTPADAAELGVTEKDDHPPYDSNLKPELVSVGVKGKQEEATIHIATSNADVINFSNSNVDQSSPIILAEKADNSQEANLDFQQMNQKQQQLIQMMSQISKALSDTENAVIRKMAGGAEGSSDPGKSDQTLSMVDELLQLGDANQLDNLNLQSQIQKQGVILQTISNILKQHNETQNALIEDMKGEDYQGADPPEDIQDLETNADALEKAIVAIEKDLETYGDDSEIAEIDMEEMLKKQEDTIQMLSQMSKVLHDTSLRVIRKIGGLTQKPGEDPSRDVEFSGQEYDRRQDLQERDLEISREERMISGKDVEQMEEQIDEVWLDRDIENSEEFVEELAQEYGEERTEIDPQAIIQNAMQMSYADTAQDLQDLADDVQAQYDAISSTREEILTLQDELGDWPDDGSTKTITYTEWVLNEDGSFSPREVTKTMTKDEAKSLVSSLQNQIDSMSESGRTVQEDAAGQNSPDSWQAHASTSGIENPLSEGSIIVGTDSSDEGGDNNESQPGGAEGNLETDPEIAELILNYQMTLPQIEIEIAKLEGALENWNENFNQLVLGYRIAEKQTDDSYKMVGKTAVLTKNQVLNLIHQMELSRSTIHLEIQDLNAQSEPAADEIEPTGPTSADGGSPVQSGQGDSWQENAQDNAIEDPIR